MFLTSDSWVILSGIEKEIKQKIESVGVPIRNWGLSINRGILTGFNDAFIITGDVKDQLISEDPRSAELIRPILRGRDIKRYECNFADLWLINTHNGLKGRNLPPIDINDYPAIKKHLDNYYPKLSKRADKGVTPYNLRNCAYMDDFLQQKIVYREISDQMNACMVSPDVYINNKCYMITGKHLIYLISVFNSTLFNKVILQSANTTAFL